MPYFRTPNSKRINGDVRQTGDQVDDDTNAVKLSSNTRDSFSWIQFACDTISVPLSQTKVWHDEGNDLLILHLRDRFRLVELQFNAQDFTTYSFTCSGIIDDVKLSRCRRFFSIQSEKFNLVYLLDTHTRFEYKLYCRTKRLNTILPAGCLWIHKADTTKAQTSLKSAQSTTESLSRSLCLVTQLGLEMYRYSCAEKNETTCKFLFTVKHNILDFWCLPKENMILLFCEPEDSLRPYGLKPYARPTKYAPIQLKAIPEHHNIYLSRLYGDMCCFEVDMKFCCVNVFKIGVKESDQTACLSLFGDPTDRFVLAFMDSIVFAHNLHKSLSVFFDVLVDTRTACTAPKAILSHFDGSARKQQMDSEYRERNIDAMLISARAATTCEEIAKETVSIDIDSQNCMFEYCSSSSCTCFTDSPGVSGFAEYTNCQNCNSSLTEFRYDSVEFLPQCWVLDSTNSRVFCVEFNLHQLPRIAIKLGQHSSLTKPTSNLERNFASLSKFLLSRSCKPPSQTRSNDALRLNMRDPFAYSKAIFLICFREFIAHSNEENMSVVKIVLSYLVHIYREWSNTSGRSRHNPAEAISLKCDLQTNDTFALKNTRSQDGSCVILQRELFGWVFVPLLPQNTKSFHRNREHFRRLAVYLSDYIKKLGKIRAYVEEYMLELFAWLLHNSDQDQVLLQLLIHNTPMKSKRFALTLLNWDKGRRMFRRVAVDMLHQLGYAGDVIRLLLSEHELLVALKHLSRYPEHFKAHQSTDTDEGIQVQFDVEGDRVASKELFDCAMKIYTLGANSEAEDDRHIYVFTALHFFLSKFDPLVIECTESTENKTSPLGLSVGGSKALEKIHDADLRDKVELSFGFRPKVASEQPVEHIDY